MARTRATVSGGTRMGWWPGIRRPLTCMISTSSNGLDVQPAHRVAVTDLAFLQLVEHVGQRASVEVLHHGLKPLRSQVERTFLR